MRYAGGISRLPVRTPASTLISAAGRNVTDSLHPLSSALADDKTVLTLFRVTEGEYSCLRASVSNAPSADLPIDVTRAIFFSSLFM